MEAERDVDGERTVESRRRHRVRDELVRGLREDRCQKTDDAEKQRSEPDHRARLVSAAHTARQGTEERLQRHEERDREHQGIAGHRGDRGQNAADVGNRRRGVDLFLGEETEERRQTTHRGGAEDRGGKRQRHLPPEATERPDIARSRAVVDRAGDMKRQAFASEWAKR